MLADQLLPDIREYVNQVEFRKALDLKDRVTVRFLAQGEYNLNYLVQAGSQSYVLRVNTGSQMQLTNQIAYEYQALVLLGRSGVTPRAYYVNDSLNPIPYGMLVMEYLPGRPLVYSRDLEKAARTFARVHGLEFAREEVEFLVKEPGPFTGIYNEATRLLSFYFSCPQADPRVADLLARLLKEAEVRRRDEAYLLAEPWLRVINTEVNSNNFIVNPDTGSCHLIDWEKPIYGEVAQDLSHFMIATTTLWKQDYVLSREEEERFLSVYTRHLPPCPQLDTLRERVEMFKFFNYLRAVSWCAMAWTEYRKPGRPLSNQDTWRKIEMYLEPEFLKRIA